MEVNMEHFKPILDSIKIISSMKPTFCGEISSLVTKILKDTRFSVKENHYTAYGVRMVISDTENEQDYEITINTMKK
jgi:hypothetical protein